ncbi:Dimethylaniline monooxygenase [N-oxide-forming] 2 [Tolypocladium ophioglossoides CBS 100239]|uniref:Dimethylaniline monooxygenase [N-oxide-forming] 2 n=1 Tax=Tolypocladium ophioglossoides (strain CBS 100239) TaxID=1163406 RepID=A0A0L0N119_TOLOC|nr:Dimethylaniline monooxygenase [N-oxide-forming] 2 [Tolypocladium ophioglossoides CBS 100239]
MKVAVIGGGPAGLATLKYLLEAHQSLGCKPVEARLFEYHHQVGGTFAARTYEDAELVSSRQLTAFSDFRSPGPEDFISAKKYVQFLNDYCTKFNLWPHIRLQTRVVSVTRRQDSGHVVRYKAHDRETQEEWQCDAVAVCSGLHVEPNMPKLKGIEKVPLVFHSSKFKVRKQFGVDKTVLVLGAGETGSDMAYLAVTSPTRRVLMCHRDGFHSGPQVCPLSLWQYVRATANTKSLQRNPGPVLFPILGRKQDPNEPGIPIDISRANLFDTTYAHPILRNSMILWHYYYYYINTILWLSAGTTTGMDQWVGEMSPERHHPSKSKSAPQPSLSALIIAHITLQVFFNKSTRIVPYISEPYRPRHPGPELWKYALRSALIQRPLEKSNGRHVDMAPWPEEIDADGYVRFTNNGRPEYERLKHERIKPDIVVFATGYTQSLPFLNSPESLQAGQQKYPLPGEADVREIWKRDEPTVGFIGFVRPSFGAIPPLAEMQAQLWIVNLLAPHKIPRPLSPNDEPHYRLLPPKGFRITYGVDHESYAYQLAMDMNSAPGLFDILRIIMSRKDNSFGAAWRLFIMWSFGANLNTKFRLQGPWRWDGAQDLFISEEFWQTITRRPLLFGHIAVSIIPMCIFGPLSLILWLYATIAGFGKGALRLLTTVPGPEVKGTRLNKCVPEPEANGKQLSRCAPSSRH